MMRTLRITNSLLWIAGSVLSGLLLSGCEDEYSNHHLTPRQPANSVRLEPNQSIDINALPLVLISGRVTDASGENPIEGARVVLLESMDDKSNRFLGQTVTQADGSYLVSCFLSCAGYAENLGQGITDATIEWGCDATVQITKEGFAEAPPILLTSPQPSSSNSDFTLELPPVLLERKH